MIIVATGPQEKNQDALDRLTADGTEWAYVQADIGSHDDRLRLVAETVKAFGQECLC